MSTLCCVHSGQARRECQMLLVAAHYAGRYSVRPQLPRRFDDCELSGREWHRSIRALKPYAGSAGAVGLALSRDLPSVMVDEPEIAELSRRELHSSSRPRGLGAASELAEGVGAAIPSMLSTPNIEHRAIGHVGSG
jgi:hypothetical protein